MKKYKYHIILSLILIVTIVGYFLIIVQGSEELKSFFEGALKIIQVVFSIVIAYLLYDRFGTTKKILDKQNDLIIDFIEKYRSLEIYVYIVDGNTLIHSYFKPGKNLINRFDKKFINRKILFPSGSLGHPKLNKLNTIIENPLFPKELIPDISTFKIYSLTAELFDFNREDYVFLSFERIESHEKLDQKNFMKPNDENTSIKEFLSKIVNSVNSIENWVNRESSIKIKLNLE